MGQSRQPKKSCAFQNYFVKCFYFSFLENQLQRCDWNLIILRHVIHSWLRLIDAAWLQLLLIIECALTTIWKIVISTGRDDSSSIWLSLNHSGLAPKRFTLSCIILLVLLFTSSSVTHFFSTSWPRLSLNRCSWFVKKSQSLLLISYTWLSGRSDSIRGERGISVSCLHFFLPWFLARTIHMLQLFFFYFSQKHRDPSHHPSVSALS